jgi:predicted metal-dependent hydrolase
MAQKQFEIDGVGAVTIRKNRRNRHIKLTVDHAGKPKVSIPLWLPYAAGVQFALSKRDWLIETMQKSPSYLLSDGMAVGKAHKLYFLDYTGRTITSRISGGIVKVNLPDGIDAQSAEVQIAAEKACQRALKKEAEHLLPQRVDSVAREQGYDYKSIKIKRLKGRWGSCSRQKELIFNSYLMQLPWELIDYVIMHELAHTKFMSHGSDFWAEMNRVMPDTNLKKKLIKKYQPILMPTRYSSLNLE